MWFLVGEIVVCGWKLAPLLGETERMVVASRDCALDRFVDAMREL